MNQINNFSNKILFGLQFGARHSLKRILVRTMWSKAATKIAADSVKKVNSNSISSYSTSSANFDENKIKKDLPSMDYHLHPISPFNQDQQDALTANNMLKSTQSAAGMKHKAWFYDTNNIQDARRYFLGNQTHSKNVGPEKTIEVPPSIKYGNILFKNTHIKVAKDLKSNPKSIDKKYLTDITRITSHNSQAEKDLHTVLGFDPSSITKNSSNNPNNYIDTPRDDGF